MLSFKRVLWIGCHAASGLILTGLWPDNFVWHVASEKVSCTSGAENRDAIFKSPPVCDDLGGHIDRVGAITKQIVCLADWSDVSSQDDERVVSALKRVGVLNNEREALYSYLSDCVASEIITPDEHEFISSTWIAPAWRSLADASTRLDMAISFHALGFK